MRLGPGSTWGRVLSHVHPTKFTMIHGQCLDVGVGGYLLGGGVNVVGTLSKFGTGTEHVKEYTIVDGNGDILHVRKGLVTKYTPHGQTVRLKMANPIHIIY